MKEQQRLTLNEIAKRINISRTTIYNVVNHKDVPVSDKTKKKVLDALQFYHYTPNNNARNLARNKSYPIAVIDYDSPNAPYFRPSIERGLQSALTEFEDNGLIIDSYVSSSLESHSQIQNIHTAFQKGIRNFIIAAAQPDIIAPLIRTLKEKGCKVILLSKKVPDVPYDAYIGVDDYKAGSLAGELLCKMLPEKSRIQVLMGQESPSSTATSRERLMGFTDYIKQNESDIHLLPILQGLNSQNDIFQAMDSISSQNRPDGILDLTYHPEIVASYVQCHYPSRTRLVTMDLFPEDLPCIENHTIDAVIFQNLAAQANLACRILFNQMCYGTAIAQKEYYAKLEVIVKGNLEYFRNEI